MGFEGREGWEGWEGNGSVLGGFESGLEEEKEGE